MAGLESGRGLTAACSCHGPPYAQFLHQLAEKMGLPAGRASHELGAHHPAPRATGPIRAVCRYEGRPGKDARENLTGILASCIEHPHILHQG
jgi:hypothetical protein